MVVGGGGGGGGGEGAYPMNPDQVVNVGTLIH